MFKMDIMSQIRTRDGAVVVIQPAEKRSPITGHVGARRIAQLYKDGSPFAETLRGKQKLPKKYLKEDEWHYAWLEKMRRETRRHYGGCDGDADAIIQLVNDLLFWWPTTKKNLKHWVRDWMQFQHP